MFSGGIQRDQWHEMDSVSEKNFFWLGVVRQLRYAISSQDELLSYQMCSVALELALQNTRNCFDCYL